MNPEEDFAFTTVSGAQYIYAGGLLSRQGAHLADGATAILMGALHGEGQECVPIYDVTVGHIAYFRYPSGATLQTTTVESMYPVRVEATQ